MSGPRLIVGVPTLGRGAIVTKTVRHLALQSRLPDCVIVSGTRAEDFGDLQPDQVPFELLLLTGPKGTCSQRNLVLELLGPEDIVLFLDDDFLLTPEHLAVLERLFRDRTDIVMSTGQVMIDGILGPGLSFEEGLEALEAKADQMGDGTVRAVRNAYGCNMAVRMRAAIDHDLRFDTALPPYGWFEDVDFSIRAARHGGVVYCDDLRGVHLGTKITRTSGRKLGYSQVANLVYLMRKGVLPTKACMLQILRNFAANCARSVRPVVYADHRGRLIGNFLAFGDLLRGRVEPRRSETL